MDLSALEKLGSIAGVAGIAMGLIALLVRPIVDHVSVLPKAQRGPMLRLVTVGAFAIGALGILVWGVTSLSGHNTIVNGAPCSSTSAGPSSNNSVSCGLAPKSVETKP
jgi:uncharacterized membrane protein YvlD (DUF360 family)